VQDAYTNTAIFHHIATSLNTPHLPTRKGILDLLTFFIHERDSQAFPLVINALETLSATNNEAGTPYAYWFTSMKQSLSERGPMGGLAWASNTILQAVPDSLMIDYAVCTPVLAVPVQLLIRP